MKICEEKKKSIYASAAKNRLKIHCTRRCFLLRKKFARKIREVKMRRKKKSRARLYEMWNEMKFIFLASSWQKNTQSRKNGSPTPTVVPNEKLSTALSSMIWEKINFEEFILTNFSQRFLMKNMEVGKWGDIFFVLFKV